LRRIVACFLMLSFVVAMTVSTQAQDKGKTKKTAKQSGTIEVKEGKDMKFRFTVGDNDGKFLALSGAYADEKAAEDGIEALKEAVANAKVVTPKKADKADK
jgi:uncharacterized protein YegP (UPF0339 family)